MSRSNDAYGEHDSADAVIRHLASVDHDYDEDGCDPSIDGESIALGSRRWAHAVLDGHAAHDGIVASAMGELGNAKAIDLYMAERVRLRGAP